MKPGSALTVTRAGVRSAMAEATMTASYALVLAYAGFVSAGLEPTFQATVALEQVLMSPAKAVTVREDAPTVAAQASKHVSGVITAFAGHVMGIT